MDKHCSFEVNVTGEAVHAFSQLTGDLNPLHVDLEYAKRTEFGRPVAHGAFLVGLASRVLGMHIPGTRCLVLSLSARFPKPLFYPARVRVTGQLRQFNRDRGAGSVQVRILDLEEQCSVLEAEVSFALHGVGNSVSPPTVEIMEAQEAHDPKFSPGFPISASGKLRLLVTGGTGGIGSRLLPDLTNHYDVSCVTREPLPEFKWSRVLFHRVDLEEDGALELHLQQQDPSAFYGVVHLSVPAVPRAFVSDDILSVRQHLRHAVEVPLLLAKWARGTGSNVKRIVMVGSTAGATHPKPEFGAYSLGKAAMEHLARLLPSDLSAQGATVNIVVPGLLSVGVNQGLSERAQKALTAKIPTGRLVEPKDIAATVLFLLSDAASQINGATIAVDGGMEE